MLFDSRSTFGWSVRSGGSQQPVVLHKCPPRKVQPIAVGILSQGACAVLASSAAPSLEDC